MIMHFQGFKPGKKNGKERLIYHDAQGRGKGLKTKKLSSLWV